MTDDAGVHKSAVLLRALGEEAATEVLGYLEASEARRLRAELAALSEVAPGEVQRVLDEYDACCASISDSRARTERASESHTDGTEAPDESPTGRFSGWSAAEAAQALAVEPPQAIAAILKRFERPYAEDVIAHLPDALQDDVAVRFDSLTSSETDALDEIEAALAEILSQRHLASPDAGTVRQFASPQSAATGMPQSFADVGKLDRRLLGKLLRDVPEDLLVRALKGSEADVLDRFCAAMEERTAKRLCETLAIQGPLRVDEIEQAQRQIVRRANEMLASAEMSSS